MASETHFVREYDPPPEAIVELKNGRFVDVVNGRFFDPSVRVMIEGTRVRAMPGVGGEPTDIMPDYTIDLQGKTVMPGLCNTHCHVSMVAPTMFPSLKDARIGKMYGQKQIEKNMSECLIHGITNIRDACAHDLDVTNGVKDRIAKGEMMGPRILQSVAVVPAGSYLAPRQSFVARAVSGIFMPQVDRGDRRSGVLEFPVDADEAQVRAAVDRAVDERGAEAIKIGEQREDIITYRSNLVLMTMEQFRVLVNQARKRGLQTLMHHVSVESFRRGVEAGVSSLSHIPFDAALTQEDVDAFVEAGCVIEPTISAVYALCWKVEDGSSQYHPDMERLCEYRANGVTFADLADEFFIPEFRESLINSYKKCSKGSFKMLGVVDLAKYFRAAADSISRMIGNVRELYRGGATIALANDGGVPPCMPPMMGLELGLFDLFLNREPGEVVFGGVDALRIATINSARSMGLDEQFGTIETGKVADIAIIDGDPFEDFRVIGSRVAALFMDGRMLINNCGLEVKPVKEARCYETKDIDSVEHRGADSDCDSGSRRGGFCR
jgi:imidazolonepropionase-like amidohydrolase